MAEVRFTCACTRKMQRHPFRSEVPPSWVEISGYKNPHVPFAIVNTCPDIPNQQHHQPIYPNPSYIEPALLAKTPYKMGLVNGEFLARNAVFSDATHDAKTDASNR